MRLTKTQRAKLKQIGDKYNLSLIVLHGSRATEKIVSADPDIDIAIYRKGGIVSDEYIELVTKFMGIFGSEVDVKTLHKKNPLFFYLALRDSILLYGDRRFYNEFKAYAFRRFVEAKPLFQLRDHLLEKGIERLKRQYDIV